MWSSAEVHFAQRLASNEKKIRGRAVNKLKKYLQAKSSAKKDGGFSEEDLLKIWKGLHYCMWMQDKPLIQEELASTISSLLHIFPHVSTQFQFLKVFFQTEAREWNGIDRWRLDKFMMLVRKMLQEAFQMLKRLKFVDEHVNKFISLLLDSLLSPPSSLVPDGLKIHLIDIYLEELIRSGIDHLNSEQAVHFLEPFLTFMQKANKSKVKGNDEEFVLHLQLSCAHVNSDIITLVNRVISRLLKDIQNDAEAKLLQQKSDDDNQEDEEERNTLEFDLKLLADRLFELGSSKECLERNRSIIYKCVKRFRDLHDGVVPKLVEEPVTGTDISADEINKAVQRLVALEKSSKRKRKKKKKTKNDNEDSHGGEDAKENVLQLSVEENSQSLKSDSQDSESSLAHEKKRKKKKRKMNHYKSEDNTLVETEPKSKLKKKTSSENVSDQFEKDTAKECNSGGAQDANNTSKTAFQHQGPSLAKEGNLESPYKKAKNNKGKLKTVINVANISQSTSQDKAGKSLESSAIQSLKSVKDMRSKFKPTEDGDSSLIGDEESPSPSKKQKKDNPLLKENSSTSFNSQTKKNELKTGTPSRKDRKQLGGKNSPKQHDVNVYSKLSDTANIDSASTSLDVTKLKSTPVSRGNDPQLEEGEIEIYLPNKKYKGNLKGTPVFKGKSELAVSEEKKTPMSAFARFEKAKIPKAYVQKALFKKSPAKQAKEEKDHDTSLTESSKKRVSFDMKKNKAVANSIDADLPANYMMKDLGPRLHLDSGYQESLNVSPVVPFNPDRKPEQGILKSPAVISRIASPKVIGTPNPVPRLKGQKLSSYVPTPVIVKKKGKTLKRARAADFF